MPFHCSCSTSHMQTDISHCTNKGNELFLASLEYLPTDTSTTIRAERKTLGGIWLPEEEFLQCRRPHLSMSPRALLMLSGELTDVEIHRTTVLKLLCVAG